MVIETYFHVSKTNSHGTHESTPWMRSNEYETTMQLNHLTMLLHAHLLFWWSVQLTVLRDLRHHGFPIYTPCYNNQLRYKVLKGPSRPFHFHLEREIHKLQSWIRMTRGFRYYSFSIQSLMPKLCQLQFGTSLQNVKFSSNKCFHWSNFTTSLIVRS